MTIKLHEAAADAVHADPQAITIEEYMGALEDVQKFSDHNHELSEGIIKGIEFRIAFRKPGKTNWTRVAVYDQVSLRRLAVSEMRQRADVLGRYLENLTRRFILRSNA